MTHMLDALRDAFTQTRIKAETIRKLELLTGARVDPAFISEHGHELCCRCGYDTGVPALTPIFQRHRYVTGVGQFCRNCY
ncbi:MAG: hypothetical protein AB7E80_08555 [Hyphomicrobiaceae bacterium]